MVEKNNKSVFQKLRAGMSLVACVQLALIAVMVTSLTFFSSMQQPQKKVIGSTVKPAPLVPANAHKKA
jgi:hypothetical protein